MSKLSEFDSILAEFEKEIAKTRSVNGLTDELLANEKAQVAKLQEVIQQLQSSREAFDRTTESLRQYIEEERNRPRPDAARTPERQPDVANGQPAAPADYFSTLQLDRPADAANADPPAVAAPTTGPTDDRISEMLDAGFQVLSDQQKLARQHLEELHENTLRQLLEQAQQLQQQAPTSTGGLVELIQTRLDDQRNVVKQAVENSLKGVQDEVAIQVEEIRLMLIEQNRRAVMRFFGLLAGILALAGVVAFFIFMQMK